MVLTWIYTQVSYLFEANSCTLGLSNLSLLYMGYRARRVDVMRTKFAAV